MAEEHTNFDGEQGVVESKNRGMFDFLGKKAEEKTETQQEAVATKFHKAKRNKDRGGTQGR
ncbi:hypothetical protein F3Y22_tig00112402pilonHSYRG00268 [Hibiscus syriacus]|uniref:Uncharacterized protein n=1 Tax=Hibiscus syriacus TaxID=106335 RepID=A0A6A2Y8D2_HIBSY|nr:hypothetical protein F3Y22_tig00112402pilonHSYRG00268 [Hibiscus syriacus]